MFCQCVRARWIKDLAMRFGFISTMWQRDWNTILQKAYEKREIPIAIAAGKWSLWTLYTKDTFGAEMEECTKMEVEKTFIKNVLKVALTLNEGGDEWKTT